MVTAISVFKTRNSHCNNTKMLSHWKLVREKQVLEKRMDCLSLKDLNVHPPRLWVYGPVMRVSMLRRLDEIWSFFSRKISPWLKEECKSRAHQQDGNVKREERGLSIICTGWSAAWIRTCAEMALQSHPAVQAASLQLGRLRLWKSFCPESGSEAESMPIIFSLSATQLKMAVFN